MSFLGELLGADAFYDIVFPRAPRDVPVFETRPVVEGLGFGEGPRWRNGKLFFSDFYQYAVKAWDPATGALETVLQLPDGESPSGLGWLPDGRLLVVSMQAHKVLCVGPDGRASDHADLRGVSEYLPNDMVVSADGTAYVGCFAFELDGNMGPQLLWKYRTGTLAVVPPSGTAVKGPSGMHFSNGPAITPDGRTLIVAETFASRLTAFDILPDGTLANRRVWARTPGTLPDGICLCEDGTVWAANPTGNELHRWAEGGIKVATIRTSMPSFAVALGGPEGKTAYVMTSKTAGRVQGLKMEGKIEAVETDVRGAGI
ncbi:gluconolactonase [Hyaloraphidium curvatum]|nr:gluconolactonase [Hyaloraphidium curvatum]